MQDRYRLRRYLPKRLKQLLNPMSVGCLPTRSCADSEKGSRKSEMIFHIYGKPVPKGRPRAIVRGRFATFYTPKRTREWETSVARQIKEVMDKYGKRGLYAMIPKPKSVYVDIVFNYTKSIRGDVDNLAKCILDAMNQLVFEDDSQISTLNISKRKDTKDEIRVMVWVPTLDEEGKLQES